MLVTGSSHSFVQQVDRITIKTEIKSFRYPAWAKDTVNVKKLKATDFYVKVPKGKKVQDSKIQVLVAKLQTDIITKEDKAELNVINENVRPVKENDVWKVAVIDRHKSSNIGIGFMKGFNTDIDAFAGTINVCENQLVVIGSDEEHMALAANNIIDMNGGIVAIKEGQIIAKYQMDIAGIMSSKSYGEASKEYEELNATLKKHGYPYEKPLNVLFLGVTQLTE